MPVWMFPKRAVFLFYLLMCNLFSPIPLWEIPYLTNLSSGASLWNGQICRTRSYWLLMTSQSKILKQTLIFSRKLWGYSKMRLKWPTPPLMAWHCLKVWLTFPSVLELQRDWWRVNIHFTDPSDQLNDWALCFTGYKSVKEALKKGYIHNISDLSKPAEAENEDSEKPIEISEETAKDSDKMETVEPANEVAVIEDTPVKPKCTKTQLLLSAAQMISENYPVPGIALYKNFVLTNTEYKPVTDNSPMFSIDCEWCLCVGGTYLFHSFYLNWLLNFKFVTY